MRTNRTAPATKYFSLLWASNKILSIMLLRRKLHLRTAKNHVLIYLINRSQFKLLNNKHKGNTLSCMGDVGHKSIVIHICLRVSLALSHSDTGLFCQDLLICCLHDQHFLTDMKLLLLQSVDQNASHRKCQQ